MSNNYTITRDGKEIELTYAEARAIYRKMDDAYHKEDIVGVVERYEADSGIEFDENDWDKICEAATEQYNELLEWDEHWLCLAEQAFDHALSACGIEQ